MADKYIFNNAGNLTEKAAIITSAGAGDSGKIVGLDSTGKLDSTFMPVGVAAEVQIIVASEAINAGAFVNIYNNGGTITIRNADCSAGNTKRADGFVLAAVSNGANGTVYFGNLNNQLSSLTLGSYYYLSTAGAITTTAPSTSAYIIQKLGRAVSATALEVFIGDTVTLA